ncbi:hypothetical protein ACFVRU_41295, partial [Streptomyces sp. NPDC057927]
TRAVAPHMIAAGWGRIVTMSSISAVGDARRRESRFRRYDMGSSGNEVVHSRCLPGETPLMMLVIECGCSNL